MPFFAAHRRLPASSRFWRSITAARLSRWRRCRCIIAWKTRRWRMRVTWGKFSGRRISPSFIRCNPRSPLASGASPAALIVISGCVGWGAGRARIGSSAGFGFWERSCRSLAWCRSAARRWPTVTLISRPSAFFSRWRWAFVTARNGSGFQTNRRNARRSGAGGAWLSRTAIGLLAGRRRAFPPRHRRHQEQRLGASQSGFCARKNRAENRGDDRISRGPENDPDRVEAHNNLANLLDDTGHPDEAIAEYQAALRINPDTSRRTTIRHAARRTRPVRRSHATIRRRRATGSR